MSTFKNLAGMLAISTAMTGAAVAMTAMTGATAGAATVMGGYVPAPKRVVRPVYRPVHVTKPAKKARKKKNKNKQWQRGQQHQKQNQFLLRDFTIVITPFQASDNDSHALPYNWQYGHSESIPWSRQRSFVENENEPRDEQRTKVKPEQEIEREQGRTSRRAIPHSRRTSPRTPIPAVTVTATAFAPCI